MAGDAAPKRRPRLAAAGRTGVRPESSDRIIHQRGRPGLRSARGLPRSDGHRAGVDAVRAVVRAAPDLGVGVLTIYGLSCDNRRRPAPEVRSILACIGAFLERETPACVRSGVRVTVLGCRERLPADVHRAIEAAERATAGGTRLHLRIAIDYSGRAAILAALLAG